MFVCAAAKFKPLAAMSVASRKRQVWVCITGALRQLRIALIGIRVLSNCNIVRMDGRGRLVRNATEDVHPGIQRTARRSMLLHCRPQTLPRDDRFLFGWAR